MGTDRIHHAFWSYMDAAHRNYEAGHSFEHVIREYYQFVDAEIGRVLELLDKDTTVLIVSDHGAKRMDGGICLNDWLIREGYLHLKTPPDGITPFSKANIDWTRTVAWGDGGYYGRIFINLKGREPGGIVLAADHERLLCELKEKIEQIPDDQGRPMGTKVYRPVDLYPRVENVAPDLFVYFGNLHWRSIGTVGNPAIHTFENDTGPDDANHGQQGMFIAAPSPGVSLDVMRGEELIGASLLDIAPTILEILGHSVPADMEGRSLCIRAEEAVAASVSCSYEVGVYQ